MYKQIILELSPHLESLIPMNNRIGSPLINIMFLIVGFSLAKSFQRYLLIKKINTESLYEEQLKVFILRCIIYYTALIIIIIFMIYNL